MNAIFDNVNWLAVILGTVIAFVLGMFRFSPKMFGQTWTTGSHNIQMPASPPVGTIVLQAVGTFLLAWMIGVTEGTLNIGLALLGILAIAVLQLANGLFSQKTGGAALIDASYVLAMGAIMIGTQAVL